MERWYHHNHDSHLKEGDLLIAHSTMLYCKLGQEPDDFEKGNFRRAISRMARTRCARYGEAVKAVSSGLLSGGCTGPGEDRVIVAFLCEQLLVVGVAVQLTTSHCEGHHAKGTVALAALEAGLVYDLALHFELLHGVHSLAAGRALVAAAALETSRHTGD